MKFNDSLSEEAAKVIGFNFIHISTTHRLPFGNELAQRMVRIPTRVFHRHDLYAILHDWLLGLGYRPPEFSISFEGEIIGKDNIFRFSL